MLAQRNISINMIKSASKANVNFYANVPKNANLRQHGILSLLTIISCAFIERDFYYIFAYIDILYFIKLRVKYNIVFSIFILMILTFIKESYFGLSIGSFIISYYIFNYFMLIQKKRYGSHNNLKSFITISVISIPIFIVLPQIISSIAVKSSLLDYKLCIILIFSMVLYFIEWKKLLYIRNNINVLQKPTIYESHL